MMRFLDLVKMCGEWWETNKSNLVNKRKREKSVPETEAPTFEEFENYAGV